MMLKKELMPVHNGAVLAMATKGDTLILGGNFGVAGVFTRGDALFTTSNDQPNLTLPKVIGNITMGERHRSR